MGCFLKALPNVKSVYVTCKEFTPDLQIVYTFLIFGLNVHVSGVKLPQWNGLFSESFTQRQKCVCYLQRVYPKPPNILHLLNIWVWCTSVWVEITPMEYLHRIWAKCTGVWGNITPLKRAVFTKLYPTSKARMLLSKNLPQTSKKFTQINLPYLWHFATLVVFRELLGWHERHKCFWGLFNGSIITPRNLRIRAN